MNYEGMVAYPHVRQTIFCRYEVCCYIPDCECVYRILCRNCNKTIVSGGIGRTFGVYDCRDIV